MAGTVNNTTNTSDTTSYMDRINGSNATKTSRGTRIVKPGQDMDQNSFLKMLSAELSNQDPQNAKDGTEYISQMAQFSGLQQMANLNSTMRLVGANSLIGKTVSINKLNDKGLYYSGEVRDVSKNGNDINLEVAVGKKKDKDGNIIDDIQEFDMSDVIKVETTSSTAASTSDNLTLANTAALIGKTVDINEKNSAGNNYSGIVKEVLRDATGIKVSVQTSDTETKEFSFDKIIKVK